MRPEDAPGSAYEASLAPEVRRAAGVHYTPPAVAEALVGWALDGWAPPGRALRALDPAAGAGAFLLAVARHRVAAGARVTAVLDGLHGTDLDAASLDVAAEALRRWAGDAGKEDPGAGTTSDGGSGGGGPHLTVADGLGSVDVDDGRFDLVVGNPPFLGQLGTATRRSPAEARRLVERFGPAARGYVDTAALFLLAALDRVRPGGRVVLVLPESVLGAAHAAGVREEVDRRARIVGLWVAGVPVFDAAVDVCALCVERRGAEPGSSEGRVRLAVGADVRPVGSTAPPPPGGWSRLLARARGVPTVDLGVDAAATRGVSTVGDVATATAGFRQHHYALVPHLVEDRNPSGDLHPVVTTGMVDPGVLRWGDRTARIGGRRWTHPAASLAAVAADDARVGAWFRDRLGPKVLVAPQGKVVEAAVDAAGRCLPATPLVAVAPRPEAAAAVGVAADLVPWLVLAALSAPPASAWVVERSAGTGRGRDSVRVSARTVLAVPVPPDRDRWVAAAERLRSGDPVDEVAVLLTEAHGLPIDHPVVGWWRSRRPAQL